MQHNKRASYQDRLITNINRPSYYNQKKPLFVLYNKKEALIKSICFFAIGCLLLSIMREKLPFAFVKGTELIDRIMFFITLIGGFYLIFIGLRYDNIYCMLINKSTSRDLKSNGEILAATLVLFAFFMLSGHFFGQIISLFLGIFTMIGTKIIYIYSDVM